jgi:hypothetical protein
MPGYQEIRFRPQRRGLVAVPLAALLVAVAVEIALLAYLRPAPQGAAITLDRFYALAEDGGLNGSVTVLSQDRVLVSVTRSGRSVDAALGPGDGTLGDVIDRLETAAPDVRVRVDPQDDRAQARLFAVFLVPAVLLGCLAGLILAVGFRARRRAPVPALD